MSDKTNKASLTECSFKGLDACELRAGKYSCVVVPELGGDVMRFCSAGRETDTIEIFRYSSDATVEDINKSRVLWGLPTLYLPNRFDGGVLKTSDGCYTFPINEPLLNNFIHGWVHERVHELAAKELADDSASVTLTYEFNRDDPMFRYMPISFVLTYKYTLDANGLRQDIQITNNGDKMLPVSLCTHTCIQTPFSAKGRQESMRLEVPVVEKCELNERSLPTERLLAPTQADLLYRSGDKHPVLEDIDNDMFTAGKASFDGKPLNGIVVSDLSSGYKLINEVSEEFRFWNIWNDHGVNGYFCPEPMTAMINSANLSLPDDVTGYCEIAKGQTYSCWQSFCIV